MPASYRRAVFEDASRITGSENDLPVRLQARVREGAKLPGRYTTCGTEDFISPSNESFHASAQAPGVKVTCEKYPGVHGWNYRDAHIRDVLCWLPD